MKLAKKIAALALAAATVLTAIAPAASAAGAAGAPMKTTTAKKTGTYKISGDTSKTEGTDFFFTAPSAGKYQFATSGFPKRGGTTIFTIKNSNMSTFSLSATGDPYFVNKCAAIRCDLDYALNMAKAGKKLPKDLAEMVEMHETLKKVLLLCGAPKKTANVALDACLANATTSFKRTVTLKKNETYELVFGPMKEGDGVCSFNLTIAKK